MAPKRPEKMTPRAIQEVLAALTIGARFRVWYLEHGFFTEEVVGGKKVLWYGALEIDEEDADAARAGRPLDFQALSRPTYDEVGEVTMLHNGNASTFLYDHDGIHHIELID